MPCGSCGGAKASPNAGMTSNEVADARFTVTRDDGLVTYFATFLEADAYRNTNGGHLNAVKR